MTSSKAVKIAMAVLRRFDNPAFREHMDEFDRKMNAEMGEEDWPLGSYGWHGRVADMIVRALKEGKPPDYCSEMPPSSPSSR